MKGILINGISYNEDHAASLGKEEWSQEVKGDFGGDTKKAGEAHDAIMKQVADEKAEEQKQSDAAKSQSNEQAAAQKKLDARNNKQAVKSSTPV